MNDTNVNNQENNNLNNTPSDSTSIDNNSLTNSDNSKTQNPAKDQIPPQDYTPPAGSQGNANRQTNFGNVPNYNFGTDYRTGSFEEDKGTASYYYDYTKNKQGKKKKRGSVFPVVSLIISLIALILAVVLIVASMTSGKEVVPPVTGEQTTVPSTTSESTLSNDDTPAKDPDTVVYNTASDWINKGEIVSDDAIVKATYQSVDTVVAITTTVDSAYGISQGAGSGVVIAEEKDSEGNPISSYIITNHHVIDGASTIKVTLTNGDTIDATLIGSDEQTDIGVIKVKAVGLRIAELGDSSEILLGETVIAIGNPLGEFANTVTNGIISGLERDITIDGISMKLLQTNAAVNPGNSGGGLFNLNGELIGVVNAKSSGDAVEGLGFAIPINTAKEIAEDLIENGYVSGRSQIGVQGWEVTKDNYSYYQEDDIYEYIYDYYYANNRSVLPGFYITDDEAVIYAEDSEKFEYGDIIAEINGVKVSDGSSITTALLGHDVGETITVSVYRLVETEITKFGQTYKTTQIKTFDVEVVLGEYKG